MDKTSVNIAFKNIFDLSASKIDRSGSFLSIGKELLKARLYDTAIPFIDEAIKQGDDITRVEGEFCKGLLFMDLNYLDKALDLFKSAGEKAYPLNMHPVAFKIDYAIGAIFHKKGNFSKARDQIESVIGKAIKAKDNCGVVYGLNQLAEQLMEIGESNSSLGILEQAYSLSKFIVDTPILMLMKSNLAKVKIELGNYKEAHTIAGEILEFSKKLDHKEYIARALFVLSNIAIATGKYEDAQTYIREARGIISTEASNPLFFEIEFYYWITCWYLNNYGVPLQELRTLLDSLKTNRLTSLCFNIIVFLIDANIYLGLYDEAKMLLSDLEKSSQGTLLNAYQINFLDGLLDFYTGKYPEALKCFESAIIITMQLKINPLLFKAKLFKARTLLMMKDIEGASNILIDIYDEILQGGNYYLCSTLLLLKSRIYFQKGDYESSFREINEAIKFPHHETKWEILNDSYSVAKKLLNHELAHEYFMELDNILKIQMESLMTGETEELFIASSNRSFIFRDIMSNFNKPIDSKVSVSPSLFTETKSFSDMKEEKYVSTVEAENLFNTSRITIFRWIKDGKLPAIRLKNRRYKILLSNINEFINTPKSSKGTTYPHLEKFLYQEEENYLTIVLNTIKSLKQASKVLGISEQILINKIKQYNIKTAMDETTDETRNNKFNPDM
jgi:tetratricopeptide (TPR) repeat protein